MLKKLVFLSAWFVLAPPVIILALFSLSKNNDLAISNSSLNKSLQTTPLVLDNNINGEVLAVKIEDTRPFIVERFLKGTPLASYSGHIVEVSDKYSIDYRLIPAIAMKESQGGLTARSSYNAWGFDNGRSVFSSWESAIDIVGKTLKTRYIDKGLTTPDAIMPIYAPPQILTGGRWAKDINLFFSQMESL